MSGLSETIKNIKCPEFTDEMIERLYELYHKSTPIDFYRLIQEENSLMDKTEINSQYEQPFLAEISQKYQSGTFQHIGSLQDIGECFGRLYINCRNQDIIQFVQLFIAGCEEKKVPFKFKYDYNNSKRADKIVIYSNLEMYHEYIRILREIKENFPEIVESCGAPPLLTGTINEWIGIGEEPVETENGEKQSYTEVREEIIGRVFHEYDEKFNILEDFVWDGEPISLQADLVYLRMELEKAFQKQGFTLENIVFNQDNMKILESEQSIEAVIFQKNREANEQKVRKEEANVFGKIKALLEANILPADFNVITSAGVARYNFLYDCFPKELKESKSSMEMFAKDKKSVPKSVLESFEAYYREWFENNFNQVEADAIKYSQLESMPKGKNKNDDIQRADLYTKFKFVVEGKEFFESIGISQEKLEEVSRILSPLISSERTITEEVIDKKNVLRSIQQEGVGVKEVYSVYDSLQKDLEDEKEREQTDITYESR